MAPQYLCRIRPSRPDMLAAGPTEREALLVSEHFAHLSRLTREGVVLLAGRTLNTDPSAFGIVIFRAADDAEAARVVDGDPAVRGGVFVAELFPYSVALVGGIEGFLDKGREGPHGEGGGVREEGLDDAPYRALFLQAADLPGMEPGESRHGAEPDDGDAEFARRGCVRAGFNAWNRIEGTGLRRVVDIRWLFPSPEQAREYHRARVHANSEGLPADPHAPGVGSEARVFSARDPFDPSVTMHIFLFVEGAAAAKVFVSGFPADECLRIVRAARARMAGSP